jgi:4-amino-4-deoxy-L-arabinose transferase-like glycosyltransferase
LRLKVENFHYVIITFYCVLLFQHAWVPGFFHDGYLYAEMGKNAAFDGYWLVPHLNNEVYSEFFHHLPFVFVLEGLFFKIFGASFVTARIFAGFFSLMTLIILIDWVKKEKGEKLAWLTGVMLTITLPLIKKSRFPNLDLPLMLFTLVSLRFYFKKSWLLCGVFFGLALLTKGPMGLFIPIIIFLHLIFTKNIRSLKRIKPWLGLGLGFAIFGIWPLALSLSGKISIFYSWFNFTFLHTITEARGVESSVFTYFIFLLKNCAPLFIASFYSFWIYKKENVKCEFFLLMGSLFLSFLLLLSIPDFKYSHYLIPLYPAMAFLAAYSLKEISEKIELRIKNVYLGFAVLVTLVLLIFPITTQIKRDPEIYKIKAYLDMAHVKPKTWKIVDGIYPYWSLNNLTSWHDLGSVKKIKSNNIGIIEKSEILLMGEIVWNKLKATHRSKLIPLYIFHNKKMVALITRDLMNDKYLFGEIK